MRVSGEMLLEGPRGRRLCLELALQLSPGLRVPVFGLAGSLDPAMGRGRAHLVLTALDDGASSLVPAGPGTTTPAEVADILRSATPQAVPERAIQAAFEQSVATARGWQEPDGEDFLAALPAVRAALLPLATRVLESSRGRSFALPRQHEQWHVDWRVAEDPVRLPTRPGDALAAWARATRAEEERAHHDRPADPGAPYSGTWWSHPQGLLQTVGRIPDAFDLAEDAPVGQHAMAVPVRGIGRTFEVATEEDWVELCRENPLEVSASRRHDWYRVTGRDGRWVIPDWERVATAWDAVHLSAAGYLRCATRALQVDDGVASLIAGWNPDTTIWLTDVAREWVGPRQVWRRSEETHRWSRTA